MQDGYYLATYIVIDEYCHAFDIVTRHDNNIALFLKENDNVSLVHYWELERLTGYKHHAYSFLNTEHAVEFINELLAEYHLTIDDMQEVWGSPKISTVNDYHSFVEMPEYAYHGLCHLYSGVLLNTEIFHNEKILAFAVDGGPEFFPKLTSAAAEQMKYYYPGCYADKGKVTHFPTNSPAQLWAYPAFRYGLQEGTLMALGSAIEFDCQKDFFRESLLIQKYDILYDTFKDLNLLFNELEDEFAKLPESQLSDRFTYEENKIAFVMCIIQQLSKEIMERNVEQALRQFDIDPEDTYLSMTGGFALNCPTNSHLMNKYKFKGFIAPPCVNDTGMSLGIGLYAFHKKHGKFNFDFQHAYYGDRDHSLDEILTKYNQFVKSHGDFIADQFLSDIKNDPIVWFNNRSEVGPRALGNRSLLADPRNEDSKTKLNIIKEREWWRPVAPLIMEQHLGQWFEDDISSPYMLQTAIVKEDKFSQVPAVLHLDKSARIQTVNQQDNEDLYQLLQIFNEDTQVPLLCNTSLNDKGEPIINKLEEAMNFALRKKIKVIYLNKVRVELDGFEQYTEQSPNPRMKQTFKRKSEYSDKLYRRINPHNLNPKYFNFLGYFPEIRTDLQKGLEDEVNTYLHQKCAEINLNTNYMFK
ncbi:carbamoyltransferase-like protein [Paenibacillus cellulosilyticus]|uniref:Carbamoyltransferase-like protein n=1 Tax=Paenibacillus cellulosilyticus TaxID=375489 RepID=A0A2V2Z2I9_9BACL|nr:carbamoyltransferase C-terminal domain-containing protein [Paenibacillus cellulosilyticus]PWW07335.1 carbamoyltransferase-like protein [Paenibacillus cellulosilyticus]QKS44486.1 carbamoyltransferase [Paenibacillus cellulosilyticus]